MSLNYLVRNSIVHIFIAGYKEWKVKAFMAVGEYLEKETITNIIALGDSQIELDAAYQLSQ